MFYHWKKSTVVNFTGFYDRNFFFRAIEEAVVSHNLWCQRELKRLQILNSTSLWFATTKSEMNSAPFQNQVSTMLSQQLHRVLYVLEFGRLCMFCCFDCIQNYWNCVTFSLNEIFVVRLSSVWITDYFKYETMSNAWNLSKLFLLFHQFYNIVLYNLSKVVLVIIILTLFVEHKVLCVHSFN